MQNGHALAAGGRTSIPETPSPPTAMSLIRAAFQPYLSRGLFSVPNLVAFVVLFVILPTLSLVLRFRRRRRLLTSGSRGANSGSGSRVVADVRRRLGGVQKGSIWRSVWEETIRTISDTFMMGGRGLV